METAQLEALATSPAALAAAFVLGTLWGSFANVCIYRWPPSPEHPHGQSVVTPGSRCGACGKPVRWYDNVPILAWLWLRGRCRDCGTQFSARYLLVEALTGLLFATVWWFAVDARAALEPLDLRVVRAAIGAAFAWTMVVVIFIDLDHMLILDRLTLPSLAGFYALGVVLPERTWTDGLIGAAVGLALVRVVADLFLLLRGKHGLGMGDGKLLAVVGALCGAVMFQALFNFNFSVVVSIGYVAAFGMATQTGVIMLVYLRDAIDRHGGLEKIQSLAELRQAVIEGAVHRLRPKLLTEGVAIVGLVPMLWASGTGAEIMRPMAAPVLGGLLISDEVVDIMIPVLFYWIRRRRWLRMRSGLNPGQLAANYS